MRTTQIARMERELKQDAAVPRIRVTELCQHIYDTARLQSAPFDTRAQAAQALAAQANNEGYVSGYVDLTRKTVVTFYQRR